jgi:hypothetical protein
VTYENLKSGIIQLWSLLWKNIILWGFQVWSQEISTNQEPPKYMSQYLSANL